MIDLYIRSGALRPSSYSKVCVVFDKAERDVFKGRIYHPASGRQDSFTRVYELLMKLEDIFDAYGFPQPTHILRTFKNPRKADLKKATKEEEYMPEDLRVSQKESVYNGSTGKATFIIKVLFRQNATWQGKIQWVEKNKTQNFRSDLEMLKLMDDALRISDNGEDDNAKWD